MSGPHQLNEHDKTGCTSDQFGPVVRMRRLVYVLVFVLVLVISHGFQLLSSRNVQLAKAGGLVMRERACDITGNRRNKANSVSKSNVHTRKFQLVNLQWRKLWWPEGDKFVRLRISTRTLKTIKKYGLHTTAKKNGVDLNQFAIVQDTPPGTKPKPSKPWYARGQVLAERALEEEALPSL